MAHVNRIGEPLISLGEVDSSNNYAMRQIQAQLAGHGTAFFAHYQNSGKGQRGREWNAEPGQNIMMSCVLEPYFLHIDNKFIVSACIALGCLDFFTKYAIDKTAIKWPNDIYWGDRKAGGILIENVLHGSKWKYAVAGMGININQTLFSQGLSNAVSLKQITGKNYDPLELGADLCTHLEHWWRKLENGESDLVLDTYNRCLYKRNETVQFRSSKGVFSALVHGVNEQGELVVYNGTFSTIAHGAAEWLHA